MKIIAELVRVRQDWDPDTNEHHNSVIFAFGGVEVEVPATPEQVKAIIVESQRQKSAGMTGGGDLSPASYPAPPVVSPAQQLGWGADQPIDESAGGPELDDALAAELTNEGGEEVFGGDFEQNPDEPVTRAPSLFQGSPDLPSEAPTLDVAPVVPQERKAPPPTPTMQRQAAIAAHRQQDPAQQRKTQKLAMRARAQAVPVRKVGKDEMGNPVVYEDRSAPIVGPAGHPTVVVRQVGGPTPVGDDDGFGQG